MDRRSALSRIGLLVGGTLSLPLTSALLSGCSTPGVEGYVLQFLSPRQFSLVGKLADFIIPETDTPGAKEAGVARFIDTLLAEYYLPAEALQFKSSFDAMDASFDLEEHTDEEITRWLEQLDQRAYASNYASDYEPPSDGSTNDLWIYRRLKELIVAGYYTSEIGMTVELRLKPFGTARYDIARNDVERSWSN